MNIHILYKIITLILLFKLSLPFLQIYNLNSKHLLHWNITLFLKVSLVLDTKELLFHEYMYEQEHQMFWLIQNLLILCDPPDLLTDSVVLNLYVKCNEDGRKKLLSITDTNNSVNINIKNLSWTMQLHWLFF